MAYKNWVLMDKIDVAVRQTDKTGGKHDFTGFVVAHGDDKALETAKDWARISPYDYENKKRLDPIEAKVYTFDNEGFTATILDSAGGSSQGGRLSFWKCKVEKDGVEFIVGVNDAILADLIRNSDMEKGKVKQGLMFARKGGQPGFIHEGMEAYAEATADMKHKADMKSMKKTSKWDVGGIYSSITLTDVCIGEMWDYYEEYVDQTNDGWYGRTEKKLRKAEKPKKVLAWISVSNYRHKETPDSFTKLLKDELNSGYVYFYAGKPPSRAKTGQLEVTDADLKLIDEILKKRTDYLKEYGGGEIKGRYTRVK